MGNLRFKIDWVSLRVGRRFTVFALFCFVFEDNFQVQAPGELLFGGAYFRNFTVYQLTYGMNISFQRARTTTTVSIKLTAVLILSVQLKTFVTSVYNDPYIFHKTIYSTNRKHGVHLTWRDCLGKYPFGWLLFKLENKQESDSTQSLMNNLLYFNSLCTDVPPPSRKIGRGDVHIFGS